MQYGLYYNKEKLGDILFIVFNSNTNPNKVIKKDHCTILYKDEKIVGINIFNISSIIKIKAKGFIPYINMDILNCINSILINEGVEKLPYQDSSGFTVAQIVEIDEHPDSDHLHVLSVFNGKDTLQIVCGASNVKVGMKVVLANLYAFMPSGQQILPAKLLGIESYGMLCSGRELNLDGYENKKGLLELDDSYDVGEDFWRK
ncbi:MAG: DUF4479 domain-containing protein [Candidatus Onthovivens sp.]|nr:DUF4479 domain-containing protein [Candidatus Onthovivens sp.]